MPIDRNNIRNQYESEIKSLLKSRTSNIGKSLLSSQATQNIGRNKFMELGNQFSSALGLKPVQAASSFYGNKLGENLNLNILGRMKDAGNSTGKMSYENLLRNSDFANQARVSAEDYSTQAGDNEKNRGFQALMADKQRQGLLDREAVAGGYAQQGINMQNQVADEMQSSMYQQALYRSLFGLGGAAAGIATISAMRPSTYGSTPDATSASYRPTSFGSSDNTYLDAYNRSLRSQPINMDWRKYNG